MTCQDLQQFNSSLPSIQSFLPLHINTPGIQDLFLHWNWSERHVIFWHIGGISSSLSGQSLPPSQSQLLCIHVIRSLHWYSVGKHGEILNGFVQFYMWKQKKDLYNKKENEKKNIIKEFKKKTYISVGFKELFKSRNYFLKSWYSFFVRECNFLHKIHHFLYKVRIERFVQLLARCNLLLLYCPPKVQLRIKSFWRPDKNQK